MTQPGTTPEPPKGSILARAAMGAGWMFAWRMTTRLLGLASTLILVRLLAPEDFGLFGLAFAVIATLETMLATGVDAQVVRARQTSRALYDTIFTMGVIRGALLTMLMLAAAAPAADFFREPRLEAVMLVLAAIPLLGSLGNVGTMEFSRNLDFAQVFRLLIVPRLLQIVATIAAAAILHSHWALIVGAFVARIAGVAMSYAVHPYRPRLSLELWRELIGISFWSWAISLATALRDRTPTFVIGRTLGMRDLGIYTMSVELASLPTSEIASPISQVAMPGLAASLRSGDAGAAADAFLRILGSTLVVTLPAAIGISLVAGPFVVLLLGQRWLETVPLIAILGATWIGYSITMIGMALLDAQARLKRLFVFVMIAAVLRGTALVTLGPEYGLVGICIGLGGALLLEAALIIGWCLRLLGLPLSDLARVSWRPAFSVAAMTLVLWACGLAWPPPPADTLTAAGLTAAAVSIGAATYVASLGLLWLVAGRPPGAEWDLLAVARKLALGAKRLLPAATPPART